VEFSFDGHPLLFDGNEEVDHFVAHYQRFHQRDQVAPATSTDGIDTYSSTEVERLPQLNYPPAPELCLNQLYWPTGATRWSRLYALADQETVETHLLPLVAAGEAKTLKISFDLEQEFQMLLLPPVPISAVSENALFLCPFVDERWKWQYKDVGEIDADDIATWTALFSYLESQLGATLNVGSVDSAYLIPNPVDFLRPYENAAAMLEAAATSVGMRVSANKDGTIDVSSPSDAETNRTTNTTGESPYTPWYQVAGGAATPLLPEKVVVTFPRWPCGTLYAIEKTVSANYNTVSGTSKTIHSSALARGGATPTNNGDLDSLAEKVAEDWSDWQAKRYDYTYIGLKEWVSNGYDDHTLYDWSSQKSQSVRVEATDDELSKGWLETEHKRHCTTRIVPVPLNFGMQYQMSGDDVPHYEIKRGDDLIATSTTVISAATDDAPGSGTASIRRIVPDSAGSGGGSGGEDPGEYETIITGVTVYNDCEVAVPSGYRIQLKQDPWCKFWVDVECCDDSGGGS